MEGTGCFLEEASFITHRRMFFTASLLRSELIYVDLLKFATFLATLRF